MKLDITQALFLLATLLGTVGLIYIIYSRNREAKKSRLFILTLLLVIGYIISHSIHFLLMQHGDVTILDNSCHSFLLLIVVTLTFFTWNFPHNQKMGFARSILILLPSLVLLYLLWSGNLVQESHAHEAKFEAHYTNIYTLFLIWYAALIGINFSWLVKKFYNEEYELARKQILTFLIGLIITNLASFIFGLFLPWFLGFYYLVEISPLAFLAGIILFTTVAVSKFDMFTPSLERLHNFSITKKVFFSAVIIVPIIILLIQIPIIRFLFQLESNQELLRYFLVSVLGGIIVSVSIAFVIIKIISNPLNRLKDEAQEIEKGNYDIRVDFNSNDEIGELTNAFNNMSQTLKHNSTELQLKENRISLLLNAFEKSSAAIAIVDSSFNIIEANHQFNNIVGKNRNDVLYKNIVDLQFQNHLSANFEIIKNELQLYNKFRDEISFNDKTLLISVTPSSNGKKSDGYLFIEVDITEQKRLEEQLANSEMLAALGKMAAVLAHEIKTPLTSIKMNADIISQVLQLNEEEKENFAIIQTEINRLNNLVKDVLQFSRQMELEYSSFNLFDMIENIKLLFENRLKDRDITLLNTVNKIEISADEHKLNQVFLNLIDNSIDAINKNGEIEISSAINEGSKQIKIFIKDSGIGINPDIKIFEPFISTKSSGTGLGLSVSQKIIEQHKGSIKLISSEQGKTVFEISLPLLVIR